jgi:hypothetical protein
LGHAHSRAAAGSSSASGPWSAEEDAQLLAAFDSGQARADIARAHERTLGGIEARLEKLGRLAPGESGVRPRWRAGAG